MESLNFNVPPASLSKFYFILILFFQKIQNQFSHTTQEFIAASSDAVNFFHLLQPSTGASPYDEMRHKKEPAEEFKRLSAVEKSGAEMTTLPIKRLK